MRIDDLDINETAPAKKKIQKKRAAGRNGLTAFLTLIIGLLLGALTMLLVVYYTGPNSPVLRRADKIINVGSAQNEIDSDKNDKENEDSAVGTDAIEEQEVDVISFDDGVADIDETAVMNSNERSEDSAAMTILKESLVGGDNISKALRKSFRVNNELICARDGKYYFFDINDALAKNDFVIENLQINENGRYDYYFADGSKARTGVDVSKYQGEIDWEEVAADGIDFAIVRAGIRGYESGKLVMDEGFAQNITSAISAGIDVGIYFFSQAKTVEEAVEEADAVIEMLDGNGLNYPFVFDLEYIKGGRRSQLSAEEITDIAIAFCDRAAEYGYTPMIYGNLDTFLLQLDLNRVQNIQKWLAYYDTDFYYPYEYQLWQYTDSGVVSGIGEEVDLNLDLRH